MIRCMWNCKCRNSMWFAAFVVAACAAACIPDVDTPRGSEPGATPPPASAFLSSDGSDSGELVLKSGTAVDTLERARQYLNYRYVPQSDGRVRYMGVSLLERVDGGDYAIWLVVSGDTSMIWLSRLLEGAAPDPIRVRWALKSLWEVRDARILPDTSDGTELSFGGFCRHSHGVRRKDIVAIIPMAAVGSDVAPMLAWMADPVTERIAPIPVEGLVCTVSREGG